MLFLYLSVSTCLKGLNEITVIQPDHRTEEIQMVFTSSPVYITFTLFHSFSFLDFLILLPPFFTCPALFISPYFPCSSPFTPSTYLYINTLKNKKKFSCWLYWQKSWQWILVWRLCFLTYCFLFLCLDDIVQKDDTPMYAAQIGSELQKQFAILPGWFDIIHMHKVAVNYFKTYITFSSFWYVKNMRVDPALWISLYMSVT